MIVVSYKNDTSTGRAFAFVEGLSHYFESVAGSIFHVLFVLQVWDGQIITPI